MVVHGAPCGGFRWEQCPGKREPPRPRLPAGSEVSVPVLAATKVWCSPNYRNSGTSSSYPTVPAQSGPVLERGASNGVRGEECLSNHKLQLLATTTDEVNNNTVSNTLTLYII